MPKWDTRFPIPGAKEILISPTLVSFGTHITSVYARTHIGSRRS